MGKTNNCFTTDDECSDSLTGLYVKSLIAQKFEMLGVGCLNFYVYKKPLLHLIKK